jgi:RNA polymerase sigma-70 factor (ECF subfamily)
MDTTMGGASIEFPVTSWTAVLGAREPGSPVAREHLERLCRLYWKPVYFHVRHRWAKSNEDAKDLTQAFFAWFLEKGGMDQVEHGRGRFRNFVKVVLDNFLRNQERSRRAVSRGGTARIVPIDAAPEPPVDSSEFDELWAAHLLQEALRILEERYQVERKRTHWRVLQLYYLAATQPTYAELARELRIGEDDVQKLLKHGRGALREIVRSLVRETLESPADLDDEMLRLFHE